MKTLTKLMILATVLPACVTTKRTKHTDARLTVAIAPGDLLESEYQALRQELIETGQFIVIDRARAFDSVLDEQDLEHDELSDRFSDEEKHARYGELKGVGSLINVDRHCTYQFTPFIIMSFWNECTVSMTLIDASTGQIITQVTEDMMWQSPRWGVDDFEDLVEAILDQYPSHYKDREVSPHMKRQRQKAKAAAAKARQHRKNKKYQRRAK